MFQTHHIPFKPIIDGRIKNKILVYIFSQASSSKLQQLIHQSLFVILHPFRSVRFRIFSLLFLKLKLFPFENFKSSMGVIPDSSRSMLEPTSSTYKLAKIIFVVCNIIVAITVCHSIYECFYMIRTYSVQIGVEKELYEKPSPVTFKVEDTTSKTKTDFYSWKEKFLQSTRNKFDSSRMKRVASNFETIFWPESFEDRVELEKTSTFDSYDLQGDEYASTEAENWFDKQQNRFKRNIGETEDLQKHFINLIKISILLVMVLIFSTMFQIFLGFYAILRLNVHYLYLTAILAASDLFIPIYYHDLLVNSPELIIGQVGILIAIILLVTEIKIAKRQN